MYVCSFDVGFVKVHVLRGKDRILGATIVSPDAGNLISEVSVAMQAGLGIGALANVIHPYPTQVRPRGFRCIGLTLRGSLTAQSLASASSSTC